MRSQPEPAVLSPCLRRASRSLRPRHADVPGAARFPVRPSTSATCCNRCRRVGPTPLRQVVSRLDPGPVRPRFVRSGRWHAPPRGVRSTRPGPRTIRKQLPDRAGKFRLKPRILAGPSHFVALPAAQPQLGVGEAFLFGPFNGLRLGEDAPRVRSGCVNDSTAPPPPKAG